ncbi:chemotaxis protein CheW [Pseudoduganella sp. UC29_71]|uniref:chemotaxis protein CheW n=1 Tax=Pseudoduganella sp. UC29_71 TaxID=3350174 RepID=UPI0036728E5A
MNAQSNAQPNALAPSAAGAAEPKQYLTFVLGGEIYAVGILAVKEIIEYAGLTSVPMMPEAIRGVINLRGAVVPVMDLAARFGRQASEITKRTCIIIVEVEQGGEQQVIGVMVDAVNAVLEIAAADIEPAPSFGARIRSDFIAGMGKVNGKFVILLDASQVLSVQEISALASSGERALAVEA